MNCTYRLRLNLSNTLLLSDIQCDGFGDWFFNVLYGFQLVKDYGSTLSTNDKLLNLGPLNELIANLFKQPVLVVNLKLILEARAPEVLSVKCLHGVDKCISKVSFCKCDALYLLEGTCLLLTSRTCILECLVLGLDSCNLTLDFLFPTVMFVVNALVGFVLKVTNLVQLGFFFDFKECLFNCLGQKYVKDWLDFTIVVKEIVVLNLCDLIDTGLFGDIRRSGWARNELISLALHLCLLWPTRLVLLGQEVS